MSDHHTTRPGYAADVTINGQPASQPTDVARVLAVAFPGLRFATSDIEDDGLGGWLIPVPAEVAALVMHQGEDFEWAEGPLAVFVPAP